MTQADLNLDETLRDLAEAALKALPKNRQEELKAKATETSDALREKAYDAAYATADFAGDVTEKAKAKAAELKDKSQEKYGEKIDLIQSVTSRFAASKLVRGFGATGMAASVAKTAMRKYSHKKSSKKETK
ncbi:hypothetical protein GQS40_02560|uniref:Uncharacterized protein n=1 Tax=Leuconostoc lactis TaxID=1246 RepID=A0A6L7AE09_LEULA|nr:hypothetical protein [Leuconostoc lactis]